ncbi:MAG: hypothetical protein QOH17_498, partial [Pseudonocardiales bacterium]|nr:hypothetical protein [Pseudonocardiales bacterium]
MAPDPSSAVRGALALVGPERDDDAWEAWLGQRIDPGWRPGEWNGQAWLFTGDLNNPQTSLWRCSVWACVALLHSRHGICRACQIALAAAGAPREEFVASYVPQPKTPTATIKDFCAVSGDGQRCRRPALCQGLCGTHYSSWKNHLIRARAPRSFDDWVSAAEPFTILVPCLVLGCDGPGMNGRGLCTFHWRHWSRDNNRGDRRATAIDWAATQRPYLGPSRFSLIRLAPLVRCEVLFALQQRDELGRSLCPKAVREVIARLTDVTTLRDPRLGLADLEPRPDAAKAVLRQLRWSVELAYDEYCGVAAIDKDLLDLRAIGLKSGSRIGRRVSVGTANLAEIPQLWLRALLRAWLDAERPNGDYFHRTLRAAVLAGQALSCRPGGGHDIATLQFADMSAVADQFRNALRRDGRLYGAQERHHLFGRFCELLNFGRYTGLLDDISGSFARHPSHRIILEDPNEDEIGKAIPEFVIR